MFLSTLHIPALALSVFAAFYLTAGKANASSIFFREIGDRPRFFREKELISIHFDSPNKSMQPTRYARG